jgi:hypothetical protein
LPRLHAFQVDYGPHGFQSIALNLGDDWSVILPYARLYSNLYLKDNGTFWSAYRQNGYIPLNYVIDTAGVVRYVTEGWSEPAVRGVIEQYLPDGIEHDVGVTKLIAPSGSLDSGSSVVPACSVYNFRNNTETYPVRMRIGSGYEQVVTVTNHAPFTAVYVEFPSWTATERGQLNVTCATELPDDDMGSNNQVTGTTSVEVYDVAVIAILAPADTVDSGAVIVPRMEIANLGTMSDLVTVKVKIGLDYYDTLRVSLLAGHTDTVTLDAWTAQELGRFAVRCTAATWRGEMVPANNLLTGEVVVRSLGIEEGPAAGSFALFGAEPNPFRTSVAIRLNAADAFHPTLLRIFDSQGRFVRDLPVARSLSEQTVVWDGRDAAGRRVGRGTYFCRLTADGREAVRTLTLAE